jgi:transcriptional regulator with XRE-family HTH domain
MGEQGVTQQTLADRLGWNQQRLSRRLTDGISFVAFTTAELLAVASALDVPVTRFLPADAQAGAA